MKLMREVDTTNTLVAYELPKPNFTMLDAMLVQHETSRIVQLRAKYGEPSPERTAKLRAKLDAISTYEYVEINITGREYCSWCGASPCTHEECKSFAIYENVKVTRK